MAASEVPFAEFERFVRDILESPPQYVEPEIVAVVRAAVKIRSRFAASVAVRAFRLEHGLREVQQQLIRLQWELAQIRQRPRVRHRSCGEDVED